MTDTTTDTALAAWRRARSLADLAALTADWLAGGLAAHPGWHGDPDPETAQIADHLVALNRAGWLTIDSQPGSDPDANGYVQRHAVKFILGAADAHILAAAAAERGFACSSPVGLVPDVIGLATLLASPVMVSAVDATGGREGACWFGVGPDEEWGLLFGEGPGDLTPELRAVLEAEATIVALAAPEWGSGDGGLWDWLRDLAARPHLLDAQRRAYAEDLRALFDFSGTESS